MKPKKIVSEFNLPPEVVDFVLLISRKVRYKRKVRAEVLRELSAHFEDSLREFTLPTQRSEQAKKLIEEFGDPKSLAKLIRRGKKRCRPLWKKAILASIKCALIFIVINIAYINTGTPNIKIDYVAKLNELNKPLADESQNATSYYQKAFREIKDPLISSTAGKNVDVNDCLDVFYSGNISPEQLVDIRALIESNSVSLALYRQGASMQHCWRKKTSESGVLLEVRDEFLGKIKKLSNLVSLDTKLKIYDGEFELAIQNCLLLNTTANHISNNEYSLILDYLVSSAVRQLALSEISLMCSSDIVDARQLGCLREGLVESITESSFVVPFKGEVMFGLDIIQRTYTESWLVGGHLSPKGLREIARSSDDRAFNYTLGQGAAIFAPSRNAITAKWNEYCNLCIHRSTKTFWQLRNTPSVHDVLFADKSFLYAARYMMVSLLSSSVEALNKLSSRDKVRFYATITILALQEHKLTHGEYPETLAQLVEAGLLKEIPLDPFSDGELPYRKIDDDFMLYSWSYNMQDDGGEVGTNSRGKPMEWADNGDCIFWPIEN